MSQNNKNNKESGNGSMYIAAGVIGALAAGVGYFLGKNSERSQSTRSYSNSPVNDSYVDTDSNCAICLEKHDVVSLSCHHTFHKDCIKKWVGREPVCPKCNRPVKLFH